MECSALHAVAWPDGCPPETKDADWPRRDPDLSLLHGDPQFEQLYLPTKQS